jgi:hypothetical protein
MTQIIVPILVMNTSLTGRFSLQLSLSLQARKLSICTCLYVIVRFWFWPLLVSGLLY